MKFTNGYWLTRDEIEPIYAVVIMFQGEAPGWLSQLGIQLRLRS